MPKIKGLNEEIRKIYTFLRNYDRPTKGRTGGLIGKLHFQQDMNAAYIITVSSIPIPFLLLIIPFLLL